jgi:hypothetical protein
MRAFPLAALGALVIWASVGTAQQSLPQRAVDLVQGGPQGWWGSERAAIRKLFGQPERTDVRMHRNQDDTLSVDSIVTLHYRAATFVFYVATNPHKDLLGEVTIWGTSFLTQSPIKLGALVDEVRAYFGDASQGPTSHVLYSSGIGLVSKLELWFAGGRLVRLKWSYPLD